MPLLIAVALVATPPGAQDEIDAAQFARLMAGLHAEVRDVSFVFEGSDFRIPRGQTVEEAMRAPGALDGGSTYQGLYAYRDDGATLLDSFHTAYPTEEDDAEDPVTSRRTIALLDHELSTVSRFPPQRGERPSVEAGGMGSLNQPGSPERIVYLWFFKAFEQFGPDGFGYEFQGWEEVDGHRCLRVQFDEMVGASDRPPDRPVIRFWIDLERGGHPLKVEFARGNEIRMRTTGIELAHLTLLGEERLWFPVRGRTETFGELGRSRGRPALAETYFVLDGTVRLNQGLPDRVFSVDYEGGLAETTELTQRRRTFRVPEPRSDPEGIRLQMEAQLAAADAQADEIRATSPARRSQTRTRAMQVAFAVLGITLLSYGIVMMRRGR